MIKKMIKQRLNAFMNVMSSIVSMLALSWLLWDNGNIITSIIIVLLLIGMLTTHNKNDLLPK